MWESAGLGLHTDVERTCRKSTRPANCLATRLFRGRRPRLSRLLRRNCQGLTNRVDDDFRAVVGDEMPRARHDFIDPVGRHGGNLVVHLVPDQGSLGDLLLGHLLPAWIRRGKYDDRHVAEVPAGYAGLVGAGSPDTLHLRRTGFLILPLGRET